MFEIYGRNNCVWCDRAKNLLDEYDYDWKFFNIEEDYQERINFQSIFSSAKTVPQIRLNTYTNDSYGYTENIGGYTELVEWLKHYTKD